MKSCPTCGMAADDRASFCPCCGTSFFVGKPTPPPPPPVEKPAIVPPPPMPVLEEEKEGGHALPIVIIAVLATLMVGLCALWATGGLAAMLGKDTTADPTPNESSATAQPLPDVAATYGNGQELTTQQYLAYLYLTFDQYYHYYISQDPDCWDTVYPYGEEGEMLPLSDYIIRSTQDTIKRQIVLSQMMKDNGLAWITEDLKEVNRTLSDIEEDAFIELGFDHDSYAYALKHLSLNERSTFYGLYGTSGPRAVSELDLRQYFVQNYVSYKMISIPLTDQNGNALDPNSDAYEQILAKMSNYMTVCQQNGFNTAYVLHTGLPAEDARVDVDATTIDEALAQAVYTVPIGATSIVEYTANGTTPTVALIQRLDVYDSPTLFEESIEDILYEMHYAAFDAEVNEAMEQLHIAFDPKVVAEGKPREFLEIISRT